MSSDSADEGEVLHYAYLVLRIFPPLPTEIALFRLLTKPLIFMEAATSFTNILIWGCILLNYSDLASSNCVSFQKKSHILLGHCESCWGNYGIFHRLIIVFVLIRFHWWNCSFYDILSIVIRLFLYVDILFVTTKLILKRFRIPLNRLKLCTTSTWMSEIFISIFRLEPWWCVTIGNVIILIPLMVSSIRMLIYISEL